jgi:hypothetical protein
MKTVHRIAVHSFVDVITNSSSELFVCSGDKSLQAICQVIEKLHLEYQDLNPDARRRGNQRLWVDIFKTPTLSALSFNKEMISKDLWRQRREVESDGFDDQPPANPNEWDACYAKDRLAQKYSGYHEKGLPIEMSLQRQNSYQALTEEIWRGFNQTKLETLSKIFRTVLSENGWGEKDVQSLHLRLDGRGAWTSLIVDMESQAVAQGKLKEAKDHLQNMDFCIGYGLEIKKGDIILESASDNSVPWALMESIETTLHATRRHIG